MCFPQPFQVHFPQLRHFVLKHILVVVGFCWHNNNNNHNTSNHDNYQSREDADVQMDEFLRAISSMDLSTSPAIPTAPLPTKRRKAPEGMKKSGSMSSGSLPSKIGNSDEPTSFNKKSKSSGSLAKEAADAGPDPSNLKMMASTSKEFPGNIPPPELNVEEMDVVSD